MRDAGVVVGLMIKYILLIKNEGFDFGNKFFETKYHVTQAS